MRQYVLDANALLRFIINAAGAMDEKVLKEASASDQRISELWPLYKFSFLTLRIMPHLRSTKGPNSLSL